MIRIVLAPNAFKECLSAPVVAQSMAQGVYQACPDAEAVCVPLADGGDGTREALVSARRGGEREINVNDPLGRPIYAKYGLIDQGETAVIEMAAASGLWILAEDEKDPLHTSTYGTGELMRDALDEGVEKIIVGIGGSATVDGGMGMAAALGYRFLDDRGEELNPVGGEMRHVARIDASAVHSRLSAVSIEVACDVTNPLLGGEGAVPVFGPQKGATRQSMPLLEEGLARLRDCWKQDLSVDIGDTPGGGAAGGLGAGLMAFCGARLRSGFDLIADHARLSETLQGADLVVTGEGKIDASTAFGKVPIGVARRAKSAGVPAVALAGALEGDFVPLHAEGVTALFALPEAPMTLQASMRDAEALLIKTTEQVIRLWQCK